MADRSRAAAPGVMAGAVRAELRPGDALVVFDSVAREVVSPVADSVSTEGAAARGSLSPALIVATRAARRLERDRESVEVVVISPFASDEIDSATGMIRTSWLGAVRTVRVPGAPNDAATAAPVDVRASDGDPVAVALALAGPLPAGSSVRVARQAPTSADSTWVRAGNALVEWPADQPPARWLRSQRDTAFAVTAPAAGADSRAATVVGRFVRTTLPPPGGRTVARWSDGEPAATETALGAGCVRSVAVPVPTVGDLAVSPSFRHFASRMAAPCDGVRDARPLSDSALAMLLPAAITTTAGQPLVAFAGDVAPISRLAAWLLGLALVAGLAEMWVRRGDADAAA